MTELVGLIGSSRALGGETVRMDLPEGETLFDMIRRVQPDPSAWHLMRVWIDGHFMEPRFYHLVRPRAGRQVLIKAWVGKGIVGSLLSILLTIVAPWAGGVIAGWLGLSGTALTVGASLIGAGITLLGTMAIQSLVKPPLASSGGQAIEALPGLRGSRNEARPFGAIPLILGKHHMAGLLGSEPYTENIGSDVYLRQIFVIGYGPLEITDIKIGETPIDRFENVQVQIRQGFDSDTPITLFPEVSFQEGLSIAVQKDVWSSRFSADNVDEILVDIEWPRGMMIYDADGTRYSRWHRIQVEYRADGIGAWTAVPDLDVNAKRLRTIRRSVRIEVARGQYEVRVQRVVHPAQAHVDADPVTWPPEQLVEDVVWSALRGFRNQSPILIPKKLAMIALRIKANDQLSGVVDQLNCVASSIAPDWDGSTWVTRETANPAAIYRRLLQGPMVRRPVANARIDFADIQDFAEKTRAQGLEVNAVITEAEGLFELVSRVLAVGKASFAMRNGKYSVTLDEAQTVPQQHFSPRNIISSSFERVYSEMPDALRVQFRSAAALWSNDEVIVYNDGYTSANATRFEEMPLWGITDPDQAWKAGRYHFAAAKLRPEILTITTDLEGLASRPGSMVRVAHDALLVGLAQGRIKARTLDGGGDVTAITLDEDCPMIAGKDYGVLIRQPSGPLEIVRQVVNTGTVTPDLSFTVAIPAASAPQLDDLVFFGESGKEASDWTVREMMREDDQVVTLTLVPHAPEIHAIGTEPIPEYDPVITLPLESRKPKPPTIRSVQTGTGALERVRGKIEPRVLVMLEHARGRTEPPIARIEAQWRLMESSEWVDDGVLVEGLTRFQLRDVDENDAVAIRVLAISEAGRRSDWEVVTNVTVLGVTEPPANVQNFRLAVVGANARLTWDAVPGLDVSHYVIRWARATSGVTWATSAVLVSQARGTTATVPMRPGTYLIRAVDQGLRQSPLASTVTTDLARVAGRNLVVTLNEHPAWAGTFFNTIYDSTYSAIRLAPTSGILDLADILAEPDILRPLPSLRASGTYQFDSTVDLLDVFTSRVTADMVVGEVDLANLVFEWPNVLTRKNFFGDVTGDNTDVVLQVSISNGAAGIGPWGPWLEFEVGDYTARSFRFRVVMRSREFGLTPFVTELAVVVDMPDRVLGFTRAVPAGGARILFTPPFLVTPLVGLAIRNGVSGDRYTLAVDSAGLDIEFFNAADTSVARLCEGLARGYGEKE